MPLIVLAARFYRAHVARTIAPQVAADLRPILVAELQSDLAMRLGVTAIFPNFQAAELEILDHLSRSKDVRVFIQFGRAVLSGTSAGQTNFYDYLADTQLKREANVKILHAGADSPYLTERAAIARLSHYAEWKADLDYALHKCASLASKLAGSKVTFSSRRHREGFLWRLFILDDLAYLQPYLHLRKNAALAPVIKLARTLQMADGQFQINDNSLFNVFSDFFDFKWDENAPQETTLAELTHEVGVSAVASLTKFRQFYVFIVPRRYIERNELEVPFHGIGGKRADGEDWIEALQREAREEIGAQLRVESALSTRYLTTGAEFDSVELRDIPRPYCVYKRIRENDPNFAHSDVLWLVGYEAALLAEEFVKPQAEAAAVLYLSGDMLFKAMVSNVTYRDIKKSPDCQLIVREGVDLNLSRRAVPSGIAAIAAATERPRVLKRL
jgi:8-oxo-dGTP pyrophosphatase MutT (NUDIX family)